MLKLKRLHHWGESEQKHSWLRGSHLWYSKIFKLFFFFFLIIAGVRVKSYREPEGLHQQSSTAGHLHDQRQRRGHRLPNNWLLFQD